jgi:hypothetical protein
MYPMMPAGGPGRAGQDASAAGRVAPERTQGMTGKDQPDWQRPTAVETAVFFNELLLLAVLALASHD